MQRWRGLLEGTAETPEGIKRMMEGARQVGVVPDSGTLIAEATESRRGDASVRLDRRDVTVSAPCKVGLLPVGNAYEFTTTTGTASATRGKWQYEVTLYTAGLLQVGWATYSSLWSKEYGVGDNINTYAFDGHRVKKWNVSQQNYGTQWEVGDVVTSCIDLDSGKVDWYLNGQHLGTAYADIDSLATHAAGGNEHLVFVPAVSINNSQLVGVNFGAIPFTHPVPAYGALQQGVGSMQRYCAPLTDGVRTAAEMLVKGEIGPQVGTAACMTIFRRLFRVIDVFKSVFASHAAEYPQHLLVFCAAVWIPLLEEVLKVSGKEVVHQIASFSMSCLDPKTAGALWQHTLRRLAHQNALAHHFDVSCHPIVQACNQALPLLFDEDNIVQHPKPHSRLAYLKTQPEVAKEINLMMLRGLGGEQQQATFNTTARKRAVPKSTDVEQNLATTHGTDSISFTPDISLQILAAVTEVPSVVQAWYDSPTFHRDVVDLCTHKLPNSSVMRLLVQQMHWPSCGEQDDARIAACENMGADGLRQNTASLKERLVRPTDALRQQTVLNILRPEGATPHILRLLDSTCEALQHPTDGEGAATARLFFFLLPLLLPKDIDVTSLYPPASFIGNSTETEQMGAQMDRLGGLLSHLRANSAPEVLDNQTACTSDTRSIFERLVLLYHAGVRKHIMRTGNYLVERAKAVAKLQTLLREKRLDERMLRSLVAEAAQATRRCTWEDVMMASADTCDKSTNAGDLAVEALKMPDAEVVPPPGSPIRQLFSTFLRILLHYDKTAYFQFLPSFFLETLVTIVYYKRKSPEAFHAMIRDEPELLPFLFNHIHDARIVHPDLRDTILGVISSIFDVNDALVQKTFQEKRGLMGALLRAVLRCFQDKQLWVSSLSVLIRLTKFLEFGCVDEQVLLMLVEWKIVPAETQPAPNVATSLWLCEEWHRSVVELIPSLPRAANGAGNLSSLTPSGNSDDANNIHEFVKELFNKIGWAVSELTNCIAEHHELSPTGAPLPQLRHLQKKAAMMGDLTRRLFQV